MKRTPLALLLFAAAYVLSGQLGLVFQLPHSLSSVVWPPSGVALAGLLILGLGAWPVVFLSSFAVNAWTAPSLLTPLALAAGAALQAAVAAHLVRKSGAFPSSLSRTRDVFQLLFLGGPVGCLVNTSCSTLWLTGRGILAPADAPFHAWTWWLGGTLGVLVFVPALLIWSPEVRASRRRRLSVSLPLLALFALLVGVFGPSVGFERLATGLLFTALLGAFLLVATGRSAAIEEAVALQTAELKDGEARFRLLAQEAPVGIQLSDPEGRSLFVNRRWCEMAGLTAEEAYGEGWTRAVNPEDLSQMLEGWKRAVSGRGELAMEYRLGSRWVQGRAVPVLSSTGEVAGFIGTTVDVSEERELARMKDEFIATLSHELRTPLTSMMGSLGLLVGGAEGPLDPGVEELLRIAYRNVERLTRLLNDILDLDKVEWGRADFRIAPVPLGAALDEAVLSMRGAAERSRVSVSLDGVPEDVRVQADPDRLGQVLSNLLSNAVRHSPEGGTVSVSAVPQGPRWRVSVTDRGEGIPEAFRDRVFARFAQADASDARRKGGTGLGLSICKAVVERMGGGIGFESAPGRTTFWFELPDGGRP